MADTDFKLAIQSSIRDFANGDISKNALALFSTLGYNTERQDPFIQKTYRTFKDSFLEDETRFNEDRALVNEWNAVDLLFQLSKDEITPQQSLFDTRKVDKTIIETYLFFAIELAKAEYSRTALAQITREVNKVFSMPVMLVFKHGESITISIINRRPHKRDERKDVLEKVTLIKDISIENPHRAHIEILFDLSFDELLRIHRFTNFVELHNAWQKTLDTRELNKRFYRELSNWYFWAINEVTFPGASLEADQAGVFQQEDKIREHNAKNLIRLLTRILFIWFFKEKNLIPEVLFDESYIRDNLINAFEPKKKDDLDYKTQGSKYYRAILQNLFFATLNQTMGKREFRKDGQHMNVTNLMRYESYFKDPEAFLKLVEDVVPFMNGGLFECLDKPDPDLKGKRGGDVIIYEDGFSDRQDNKLCVPDYVFFGTDEHADLSVELGNRRLNDVPVKGLINILKSYKFTVTENTPIEEDIALDPELLGRVFENLLASYNPETRTTARKQTGSFYTPREIVNYMVDESIKAYLKQKLETEAGMEAENAEIGLEFLVGYYDKENLFDEKQTAVLINAIDTCKILDPACGSGAFPMGILHKLAHILHKLDPNNEKWRDVQRQKAIKETEDAFKIGNKQEREERLIEINDVFENNSDDYGRKLYLIENCIYGVDIQAIATQISKLRFFISLIVDQKTDKTRDNFGIRPLPNLETKFVAANTLIGIEKPKRQLTIFDNKAINELEQKLKDVRHRLFSAKTPATKRKLREEDQKLREQMGDLLVADGWGNETARQFAAWDPYDQNANSPFFDLEWMFGITDGFHVLIGNPPYVSANNMLIHDRNLFNKLTEYTTLKGKWDLYVAFTEKSLRCLTQKGVFTFIIPYGFLNQPFAEEIRKFILKDFMLQSIVDLHNIKIFENATVPSCIPVIQRKKSLNHKVKIVELDDDRQFISKYEIDIRKYHEGKQCMFRTEDLTQISEILHKIKERGELLTNDFYASTGAEIHGKESRAKDGSTVSGRSKFDVLHYEFSKKLKPYIEGSAIRKSKEGRYSYPVIDTWLDYSKPDEMRSAKFTELFESEKIIIRRSSGLLRIIAIYDMRGIYTSEKCILVVKKTDLPSNHSQHKETIDLELKYLLGIINSRLIDFYYESVYGGFIDVYPNNLKELPIVKAISTDRQILVTLVDYLLMLKKNQSANEEIQFCDRLIDSMVYELYFPEEIKSADCEVLKHLTNLPELKDDWSDEQKLATIEKIHKELSDPAHPVSIAMEKMKTVPEVRIIEGLDKS